MLVDNFNRVHDYLRISLTDNCNLRCFYCMPEEDYIFTAASKLMQHDEVISIASTFVDAGIKKIRLTGGEPLVRKDAAEIIRSLSKLNVDLTITTNGTRVHKFLEVFKTAGIKKLNISLDTLDADKFIFITRRNQFKQVMTNIDKLLNDGFNVKINVVIMKNVNDHEIIDFVRWTKKAPIEVRFIEFMPFTGNHWSSNKVFTLEELLTIIGKSFDFVSVPGNMHDTAKHFKIPGHAGSFAIISTMTAPFCSSCNRLRLTADGKLKNCLFSKDETDLLSALRAGQDITPLIQKNVSNKAIALGGQFSNTLASVDALSIENRSMITIGG